MNLNGDPDDELEPVLQHLERGIALLAAATAFLLATGCVTTPTGGLSCADSWIDPTYTTIAITILGATKTLTIVRDAITGLVKRQPPVR